MAIRTPHIAARVMQAAPTPQTVIDGRRCLYFAGSGYLGLHSHPLVIQAACESVQQYGMGSGTSRAAFGDQPPTLAVERQAADFFSTESALYLPNGYMANLALLTTIAPEFDLVAIDEHSHDSLQRAAGLCGKPVLTFRHRDPASLLDRLSAHLPPGGRALVVSDGLFSVLGTLAPIGQYVEILRAFPGSGVLVDDAHALGVLGPSGRGSWDHAGIKNDAVNVDPVEPIRKAAREPALFQTATLSKACGGYGGVIAGSRSLVERLKATSSFYSGSSPLPPPVAAGTRRAIQLIQEQPELRSQLRYNARFLRDELARIGLSIPDAPTPIAPVVLESGERMRAVQAALVERGVVIAYFARYSGVRGEGALRIAVFATHTREMIARLVDELARLL